MNSTKNKEMETIEYETIRVEIQGKEGALTLNRPDSLNTMNLLMVEELISALSLLEKADINVVVLSGTGAKFCAGADMNEMRERDPVEWARIVERYLDVIRAIIELPMPVIAAINGDAIGGGLGLCVASDIRIAVNTARLAFPFIKIGLAGSDMSSSYFLPKLVGFGRAAELLYTGRLVGADEAETIGLVHHSVTPADFPKKIRELAAGLAAGPGYALRFTKRALFRAMDNDRERQFDFETYAQTQCLQSPDHREGIAAFREKRQPAYRQETRVEVATT